MTLYELVESWRRDTDQAGGRDLILNAVSQLQALSAPFTVRLVASFEDPALGEWVSPIADFLRSYGFDVVVYGDSDVSTLLALGRERTDIFLVWSTSEKMRTLATILADDTTTSGKLIVCIPDGDDGEMYCRHLREVCGVEDIQLPVRDLQEGNTCGFGTSVLRHCSDRLVTCANISVRDSRLRNTHVVLVHGIRTRGLWQGVVQSAIHEAGLLACPTNYNKFDVARFLLPAERLKEAAVTKIEGDIRSLKEKHPDAFFDVIAHSFGSYIVGKLLQKGHKFGRVVFCGCVLPSWFEFAAQEEAKILNEVGRADVWPVLAEKLGWGYGATGTFGFNRGVVVQDRVHAGFRHSTSLTSQFCECFWVPLFRDDEIKDGGDPSAPPSRTVSLIEMIPGALFKVLFWCAPLLIAWLTVRVLSEAGR